MFITDKRLQIGICPAPFPSAESFNNYLNPSLLVFPISPELIRRRLDGGSVECHVYVRNSKSRPCASFRQQYAQTRRGDETLLDLVEAQHNMARSYCD
jgi:hypothetical protein